MNLSQRLRNIYLSQVKAIKERLDRVDTEAELEAAARRAERDARDEIADALEARPAMRTPEEIASGRTRSAPPPSPASTPRPTAVSTNPLAAHYRFLGLEEGADFATVEAAYATEVARYEELLKQFPEGSEQQAIVQRARKRAEDAFNALRGALDATAGRFDKLEL
jgi:hypothetical protein